MQDPTYDNSLSRRRNRPGTHRCGCAKCNKGPKDDALAVTVDSDGEAVWYCHRCGSTGTTRRGGQARRATTRTSRQSALVQVAQAEKKKIERARRVWDGAQPARGTLAEAYLASRGLSLPDDAPLRFVPSAWHWPSQTRWPAMVAAMVPVTAVDDARPQAVHRTFIGLDGTGKAPVPKPRLYIAPTQGLVVKLTPDSQVTYGLAIAEGLETALTGIALGYPTWATTSATATAALPVLPGIEALTILADHDRPGLEAADICAARWHAAGREVRVVPPEEWGRDWNDALQREMHDG